MKTLIVIYTVVALMTCDAAQPFFALNGVRQPILAWESDFGVTGSPASSWSPVVHIGAFSQSVSTNRPSVTASVFGSTQGLTFDGVSDVLTNSPLSFTNAATLSIVFKTGSSVTGPFSLLAQSDTASTTNYWEFGINASGKLYVSSNNNGTTLTIEGSTILATSSVYSVVLAYDGTDYFMSLGGVEENPLVITSTGAFCWFGRVSAGTPILSIGATILSSGGARFFNGSVGGVYLWNTDITL